MIRFSIAAIALITLCAAAGAPSPALAEPLDGAGARTKMKTRGADYWNLYERARSRRSDDLASVAVEEPRFNPVAALSGRRQNASVSGQQAEASRNQIASAVRGGSGSAWSSVLDLQPEPPRRIPPIRLEQEKPPRPSATSSGAPGASPVQSRIAGSARAILGKPFKYAAATKGGRLGCAQVATTILKNAGAASRVVLGVLSALGDMRKAGWGEVKPPPYRDGDVITWATYDRSGNGRIDPDTHIGVIVMEGGTPYAVHNSSSRRKPIKQELASMNYRVSRVMRKPA